MIKRKALKLCFFALGLVGITSLQAQNIRINRILITPDQKLPAQVNGDLVQNPESIDRYLLTPEQEQKLFIDANFYKGAESALARRVPLQQVKGARLMKLLTLEHDMHAQGINLNCQCNLVKQDVVIATAASTLARLKFNPGSLRGCVWIINYINSNWALYSGDQGPELVLMPTLTTVWYNEALYLDGLAFKPSYFNSKGTFITTQRKRLLDVLEQELSKKVEECRHNLFVGNAAGLRIPGNEFSSKANLLAQRLCLYTQSLHDFNEMKSRINSLTLAKADRNTNKIYLINKLDDGSFELFVIKLSEALFNDLGSDETIHNELDYQTNIKKIREEMRDVVEAKSHIISH